MEQNIIDFLVTSRNITVFFFGAIAAGYTVSNFPLSSLDWMTHPIGQYIIFISLIFAYNSFSTERPLKVNYFIIAGIFTALINGLKYMAVDYDETQQMMKIVDSERVETRSERMKKRSKLQQKFPSSVVEILELQKYFFNKK